MPTPYNGQKLSNNLSATADESFECDDNDGDELMMDCFCGMFDR